MSPRGYIWEIYFCQIGTNPKLLLKKCKFSPKWRCIQMHRGSSVTHLKCLLISHAIGMFNMQSRCTFLISPTLSHLIVLVVVFIIVRRHCHCRYRPRYHQFFIFLRNNVAILIRTPIIYYDSKIIY